MVTKNCGKRNYITTSKQKDMAYLQTIPFLAEPSAYNKTPSKTAPMTLTVKEYSGLLMSLYNKQVTFALIILTLY